MTIIEAINQTDALKPNSYSQSQKIEWLSKLDQTLFEKTVGGRFGGYNEATGLDTALLVPPPFDSIYLYWLQAQIDYWNQEYAQYNNSMTMYNTALSEYERYFIRNGGVAAGKFKYF